MKRILCGWLVVVCGVLLVSTTSAAVPFIEVPADGWDPGPEARKRYSKGIFDWARRVEVHRAALAADQIQVDLFDGILVVNRTRAANSETDTTPLYQAIGTGREVHRETSSSRQLWVGEVVGGRGAGGMPQIVHVIEMENGKLMTSFTRGHLRYQLFGKLLVRSDLRRLPNEAPTVRDPYPVDPLILDQVTQSNERSTIRVAFGYGNKSLADGREKIFSMMQRAVAHANEGFRESGVLVDLQRAGNALPGYAESTVLQTLDDLALGVEGRIWLVHRAIP